MRHDALAESVAVLAERETKIIRSKIGKNQLTLAITVAATSLNTRLNRQKNPNRAEADSPAGSRGIDRFSKIAGRIAGNASSRTTEVVYRRELPPILTVGAETMDKLFNPRAS